MADIINMPNPEPQRGGISGVTIAGFGLLAAGAYVLYKRFFGKNVVSSDSVGSGGSGGLNPFDIFDFGGSDGSGISGSGDTPENPVKVVVPENPETVVPVVVPVDTTSKTSSSSSVPKSTTFGSSGYKTMSDSVVSFLLAGHTKEEQAVIMESLAVAEFLRPDYYVIDYTRNGTTGYSIISGNTGQIVGGGVGISYADAVASGVERRAGLYVVGENPSSSGSSGSTSSSGGSAVTAQKNASSGKSGTASSAGAQALISSITSGSKTASSGSSGSSGKTVTTSTGFTVSSSGITPSSKNSAISFMNQLRGGS